MSQSGAWDKIDFDALYDEAEEWQCAEKAKLGIAADDDLPYECAVCERVGVVLCPVCHVCVRYCHDDYMHDPACEPYGYDILEVSRALKEL